MHSERRGMSLARHRVRRPSHARGRLQCADRLAPGAEAVRRPRHGREAPGPRARRRQPPSPEVPMTDANLQTLLFEQAPDAVIFAGTDGTIQAWNLAATTLFGFSAEEAM